MTAMTPDRVASIVETFAKEAIAWSDSQSGDRIKAMEYYDGVMNDTPSDKGRSSVVSRDFRAATKKVLPAITRTIFGSDKVFEFAGVGEGDDAPATQATDYINLVILPECNGEEHIRDAVHDALRIRNGILKWWWDNTIDVKVTKHTGLSIEELVPLAESPDVEILESAQDERGFFNVKLRRRITNGAVKCAAIPLEDFHISPDALAIEDATFVAHNQQLKRHQLVAMGYDREQVRSFKAYSGRVNEDAEKITRRDDANTGAKSIDHIVDMQEIDYWECFVRIDEDDDGIAELRRIVFAGGWNAENILEDEECDEAPFTDLVIERRPHEWQGRSLFDDIKDIQQIKTVLTRATQDNLYWQNNHQPVIDRTRLEAGSIDAVLNPEFGKPIFVNGDVNATVGRVDVPFFAAESFAMLSYWDEALTDRTGIADNSGGLPPDALQNVTAKASAVMEQQGINQIELMVRSIATGLRKFARGLLKLTIQHQDKPRMVRLSDKPVQFDPRAWDANMDCTVNVGLGAGTRERDMMAMQFVLMSTEKLLAAFGADDNPFVTPDNLYNVLAKGYQAAGIKNPGPYLTKPTQESVMAAKQKAASKKSPEQIKAEAQMMIEQGKAQVQMQLEQAKMQVDASKEREQRDADLIVKQKELENNSALQSLEIEAVNAREAAKIASQERIEAARIELEREKMAHQRDLEMYKADRQAEVARENADRQERMGYAKMEHDSMNKAADRSAGAEKGE